MNCAMDVNRWRRSLCLFDTSVGFIISAYVFLGTISGKSQTAISDLSQMGTTTLEKRHIVAFELNTHTREGKKNPKQESMTSASNYLLEHVRWFEFLELEQHSVYVH
ncbi:beclin 1-associated autophagy-related key regulator [Platysternon megacephalum]|uniref:Beclin 1-associated autophagy-related key regulator n=1 Tax=Platysternon megacephalum TaxID=55544 RepID=A0A4D9EJ03_9SAUR|nr:beclin 1-associated autophagy-related key regulator [Platysternon megacephalum]